MQCTALYQPSVLNSFCHLSSLLQHTFSLSISICGQFPQVHGKETGTTGTGSSGSKSSLSDFPLGCGAGSSLNKKILSSFPKGQILAHAECFDLHPRLFLPFRWNKTEGQNHDLLGFSTFPTCSTFPTFPIFPTSPTILVWSGLVWSGLASILLYLSCKHVCSCLSLKGKSVSQCDRVVWWPWLCL